MLLSRSNRTEALRKILVQRVCNNVNGMKVGSEFRNSEHCCKTRVQGGDDAATESVVLVPGAKEAVCDWARLNCCSKEVNSKLKTSKATASPEIMQDK